jgi:hypothetical protein
MSFFFAKFKIRIRISVYVQSVKRNGFIAYLLSSLLALHDWPITPPKTYSSRGLADSPKFFLIESHLVFSFNFNFTEVITNHDNRTTLLS